MQRQLQLRIEAQGKYLKKIIEEQQRLSGVLSEAPGTAGTDPASGDNCPEPDKKTDPATPAPTSESPVQDKTGKEHAPDKSHSVDESFSSQQEPSTPDSACNVASASDSPNGERSVKKQRVGAGTSSYAKSEIVLTHPILESSISSYQQPHTGFMNREQFDPSSGILIGNEDRIEVSGNDM